MLQCSIIIIDNNEEKYNNNVWLETLLGATLWNARFNRRFFRRATRQPLDAEVIQRQHVLAATSAEVSMQCVSTARRIRNEFANFLVEKNAQSPNARFFRRATRH